jgi:2-haloacid dehalogenase
MATLAFDLYGTLVDPIGVREQLAVALDEATAAVVAQLWRQRQLEYTFRLTAMGSYHDFNWVTRRSLADTVTALGLDVALPTQESVVAAYDHLSPLPDVGPGLKLLRQSGHRCVVLSNGTPTMIEACLNNSGLLDYIDSWISADTVRAFKPAPQVYQNAADIIGQPITEIRLVSSNPFDVIGAKAAGMMTAWVNRTGAFFETFGPAPDMVASSFGELAHLLISVERPVE